MKGRGQAPEAGCNCRHLAPDATCYMCAEVRARSGPGFFADDDDQDEDVEVLTDGGVELEPPETTASVDDEVIQDLLMSCRLARERGHDPVQVLAALDAVAKVQNEEAGIPDWLVLRERFDVDIREAGCGELEELVEQAQTRAWYDPRGWF